MRKQSHSTLKKRTRLEYLISSKLNLDSQFQKHFPKAIVPATITSWHKCKKHNSHKTVKCCEHQTITASCARRFGTTQTGQYCLGMLFATEYMAIQNMFACYCILGYNVRIYKFKVANQYSKFQHAYVNRFNHEMQFHRLFQDIG